MLRHEWRAMHALGLAAGAGTHSEGKLVLLVKAALAAVSVAVPDVRRLQQLQGLHPATAALSAGAAHRAPASVIGPHLASSMRELEVIGCLQPLSSGYTYGPMHLVLSVLPFDLRTWSHKRPDRLLI
jgi:hypothetical protein